MTPPVAEKLTVSPIQAVFVPSNVGVGRGFTSTVIVLLISVQLTPLYSTRVIRWKSVEAVNSEEGL